MTGRSSGAGTTAGSRRRAALLALSSPLLLLLALVALLQRSGTERIQTLPALLIGVGLLATSWLHRARRRSGLLRALREERRTAAPP